jgi:outer membrane scaffolding protein for murein synthesis (MipA/OmpV family)
MKIKRLFEVRAFAALALLAAGGAARAQTPSALAEWQFSGGVPLRAMFMPELPTWDYDIGAAFIEQPKYEGSRKYVTQPGPTIDVRYKDVAFVSTGEGLGWNIFHGKTYRLRRVRARALRRQSAVADRAACRRAPCYRRLRRRGR